MILARSNTVVESGRPQVHVDIAVKGADAPRCVADEDACRASHAWADYDLGCERRADGRCGRRRALDRNPQLATVAVATVVTL